jgi:hypothetical protein
MSEAEGVFDDVGRNVLANLLRQAYEIGHSDGAEGYEHSNSER